jgi:hypothetical protein
VPGTCLHRFVDLKGFIQQVPGESDYRDKSRIITRPISWAAVCLMIARVRKRTGLPFNAFETGAWLSFDSLINRLTPIADHLFLSKGSAITSFVRFS